MTNLAHDLDAFGDQLFSEDMIDVLDDDNRYSERFVALQVRLHTAVRLAWRIRHEHLAPDERAGARELLYDTLCGTEKTHGHTHTAPSTGAGTPADAEPA